MPLEKRGPVSTCSYVLSGRSAHPAKSGARLPLQHSLPVFARPTGDPGGLMQPDAGLLRHFEMNSEAYPIGTISSREGDGRVAAQEGLPGDVKGRNSVGPEERVTE